MLASLGHSVSRSLATLGRNLRPTDDSHRVTSLELLFDLVFVYAITNVTGLMEHQVSARTLLEGLITLAVVWFGWAAYAWLGNQARADTGLLRIAVIIAMAGMFFVAISIPYSFTAGSNAAWVLVVGYTVVRLTHLAVYFVAAGDDRQLRGVIAAMAAVAFVSLVPMFIGAAVSGRRQVWWWLLAVLLDQIGVYFVRSTSWRLPSASHFAERFGLIILIAIGESVVSVGVASATPHLSGRTALALLSGLAISVCLWWLYFDVVALVAESVLRASSGVQRARLARDSYTYLHLPMVIGIVLSAMGLVFLVPDSTAVQGLGSHADVGRYALYGGVALYLAAHLGFRLRNVGSLNAGRLVVCLLLLALIPVMGPTERLVQLAMPALLLVGLVGYEVRANAEWRRRVRAEA